MTTSAPGRSSESKAQLYHHGYFHGQTSGYPPEGYRLHHPDWGAWLDLICKIRPGGRLVDLACAYGYLVKAARDRGFSAFGIDISGYALRQEPEVRPWLLQGDLEILPFRSACADVACLFDCLEHLEHPELALHEAVRILAPEGLLVAATPDPIFFDRHEPTHFSERPPAFWVERLERQGLKVVFRFSETPFNFQLVAARRNGLTSSRLDIFQHDYFEQHEDFVQVSGPVAAVPRFGWGPLTGRYRSVSAAEASVYLLNRGRQPLNLKIDCRLRHQGGSGTLQIRLNSLVIGKVHFNSEKTEIDLSRLRGVIPVGGHHLTFGIVPPNTPAEVGDLQIRAEPASHLAVTECLPFDLFQRYELSARIAKILRPETVLDVGGVLGDQGGHLATPFDFLCRDGFQPRVVSTDLRHCDIPSHIPASAFEQPFPEGAHELALSLDVLEHLPGKRRRDFLKELDRIAGRWIILGAPFDSPEVVAAEKTLADTLMSSQQFLGEHRELGLPEESEVRDYFEGERGFSVFRIPNGYLPRWTALQAWTQLLFSIRPHDPYLSANRIYNRLGFEADQREPAYRLIWVIGKEGFTADQKDLLASLLTDPVSPSKGLEQLLLSEPEAIAAIEQLIDGARSGDQALHDVQFLVNERQKLISLLQTDISSLRQRNEDLERILSGSLWKLLRRHTRARLRRWLGRQ